MYIIYLSTPHALQTRASGLSADQLLNDEENSVVDIQNHELNEQLALINQLDEDEKNALVKIINSMLTKKHMKDLLDGRIKLLTLVFTPWIHILIHSIFITSPEIFR